MKPPLTCCCNLCVKMGLLLINWASFSPISVLGPETKWLPMPYGSHTIVHFLPSLRVNDHTFFRTQHLTQSSFSGRNMVEPCACPYEGHSEAQHDRRCSCLWRKAKGTVALRLSSSGILTRTFVGPYPLLGPLSLGPPSAFKGQLILNLLCASQSGKADLWRGSARGNRGLVITLSLPLLPWRTKGWPSLLSWLP